MLHTHLQQELPTTNPQAFTVSYPWLKSGTGNFFFHHSFTPLTSKWPVSLKHTHICGECLCFFFIDSEFTLLTICSTWPHYSSLPQLCKRTRPLCIFVLLFLLTLWRSVLINHPLLIPTAHTYTHIHHAHQSSLKTPTFLIQGLLLKQSGAF